MGLQYEGSSTAIGAYTGDGCCCGAGTVYDEVTKSCVQPDKCGCVYNVSGDYKTFTPMDSSVTYSPEDCPVYNVDYDKKYIHDCVCICEDGKLDCNVTTCQDDAGDYREPGEKWDDPKDSCKEKTCDGDGKIVTTDKEEPDFCAAVYEQCEKEGKKVSTSNVDPESCCFACEERCEKETKTDSLEYIDDKGIKCVSTRAEDIEYCKGNCGDSSTMLDLSAFNGVNAKTMLTTCRCCQGELIDKEVEFKCENGETTKINLPILASDCACSNCPGEERKK